MRFVSLAILLFCIHVSMALVNGTGVFFTTLQPADSWMNDLSKNELQNESYVQTQIENANIGYDLGDVVKGLFYFVLVFGKSLILLPWTLMQFKIPFAIATIMSIPFYMMYMFGLAQWMSNRSPKNMV